MIGMSHRHAEDDLSAERLGASRPYGEARDEERYSGEVARSRVLTANGQMYVVSAEVNVWVDDSYIVGVYPISERDLLVFYRQPLVRVSCATYGDALMRHDLYVQVLVEDGARVLRAQESLRARREAEIRHIQEYHLSLN